MADDIIALFEFEQTMGDLPKIADEKHYKLVPLGTFLTTS